MVSPAVVAFFQLMTRWRSCRVVNVSSPRFHTTAKNTSCRYSAEYHVGSRRVRHVAPLRQQPARKVGVVGLWNAWERGAESTEPTVRHLLVPHSSGSREAGNVGMDSGKRNTRITGASFSSAARSRTPLPRHPMQSLLRKRICACPLILHMKIYV